MGLDDWPHFTGWVWLGDFQIQFVGSMMVNATIPVPIAYGKQIGCVATHEPQNLTGSGNLDGKRGDPARRGDTRRADQTTQNHAFRMVG